MDRDTIENIVKAFKPMEFGKDETVCISEQAFFCVEGLFVSDSDLVFSTSCDFNEKFQNAVSTRVYKIDEKAV